MRRSSSLGMAASCALASRRALAVTPPWSTTRRLVPVAPIGRGGEAGHVPGLHLAHDALEGSRGHVMALVDDHVTVGCDDVVDGPIAHEALEHGHVEAAGGRPLPAADLPDPLRG